MESFVGRRIKVTQRGQWRYAGPVLAQDATFLTMTDEKTQRKIMLTVDSIQTVELLQEADDKHELPTARE